MPVNGWIHSTVSHNLVVVDGAEQVHRGDNPRKPRLHMMATSPIVSVVEASSDCYRQCDEYRRLTALVKGPEGRTFAVDVFRVRGGAKHAYRAFSAVASSEAVDGALSFEGLTMPAEPPLPEIGQSLAKKDVFGLRDVRSCDEPPGAWRATWSEAGRSYRLWMLSQVDAVEASNGPGQTTRDNAGRRVRYVDAIRSGEDVASVFVAVHEPGATHINSVTRLDAPPEAGPNAVALRIDSSWGIYHVFSEFDAEIAVDGMRFEGQFGLVLRRPGEDTQLFALGARTLGQGGIGFADQPTTWAGVATAYSETALTTNVPRPKRWPEPSVGCRNYVIANDGAYWTGFPVASTDQNTINVSRFPLQNAGEFIVHALWLIEGSPE
jgi:hypothetical protein